MNNENEVLLNMIYDLRDTICNQKLLIDSLNRKFSDLEKIQKDLEDNKNQTAKLIENFAVSNAKLLNVIFSKTFENKYIIISNINSEKLPFRIYIGRFLSIEPCVPALRFL